ncbi:MAG: hypothetical protein R2813_04955 [Flavobacteriales bacterium]
MESSGESGSAKVWRDAAMNLTWRISLNTGYLLKGDLFYKAFTGGLFEV